MVASSSLRGITALDMTSSDENFFKNPPRLVQQFRYDYVLEDGIKDDPVRRWNLPDDIFFGHGACPILAGVFLEKFPNAGFIPMKITPTEKRSGNHIYVTNGKYSFDYHGLSLESVLKEEFFRAYQARTPEWNADIEPIDYPLLDTKSLNKRKMLGPEQYLRDPRPRASEFIDRLLCVTN